MKQAGYDMLYLTVCALNGKKPDMSRIKDTDLEKLFQMCSFHSLTAAVCTALESAGAELTGKWSEAKAKAIRKNILLGSEMAKICGFMEKQGIWHMPLKGAVLKELYPELGMRQMSDNDILYDPAFRQQVRRFMEENGYTAKDDGSSYRDAYIKPPVYNFELHTALFRESSSFSGYYADVRERLVGDGGFGLRFKDEDFYIYMVAHEYKHYSYGGAGLRSLADFYVYRKAFPDLDMRYIEAELESLGIADFGRETAALAEKLFSAPFAELSESERESLEYRIFSGTYGTVKNAVKKKIGSVSGAKYLLRRIFPDMEHYRRHYPFFYRHKLLLPAAWLYRLVRAVISGRKRIWSELKVIAKIRKSYGTSGTPSPTKENKK